MKNIAIILTLPLLLFSFSNCGGAQTVNDQISLVQNPPFKISEAYYQNWVAGVKDGGSGTNIHVILSELEQNVNIQNIYFRNQILKAKKTAEAPNHYIGYLLNSNQRDVVMDVDPLKEAQNTPAKAFPFQLETNQAVIEYLFDGKTNYYKISNLSEKEMIPYPEANPNSHE